MVAKVTPNILKHALTKVGLEKTLQQESIVAKPLNVNTISNIADFISIYLNDDILFELLSPSTVSTTIGH
jgi:hypothetical protein